jgi:Xaa-Pro aminopeptidase
MDRVKKLKALFSNEFDGYVIANEVNMLYLTDFLGAAAMLIPRDGESTLFVYGVNYEGAKDSAKNCSVELVKRGEEAFKKLAEQAKSLKLKKLYFDTMSYQIYQKLKKNLQKEVTLEEKPDHIWKLRRVKDSEELNRMRKAADFTVEGMKRGYEVAKPGRREIEVAAEIEYEMRKHGSYGVAFETIVASGPYSAFPHGGCGERKLNTGDLVVIDIGASYKNYRSDMTRTIVIGKSSQKQKKIYKIVKDAQEAAYQSICEGVEAKIPDAEARDIIGKAGYGDNFVHGLGHGVGLEVHEQPVLNTTSKDVLEAGNVVTDEPGVYIVGFGGFRIEDTVLVKKERSERLTNGAYVLDT